jgi:3',5'-cyclic AMP phosphodiesterase CpdA
MVIDQTMPRIAIAADLHYGNLTAPAAVERLVEDIRIARPDALVLAGDLGQPSRDFAACLAAFQSLAVPTGVLAGNHDVWREEGAWSSRALWERHLPALTTQAGFLWLESGALRLEDVAVVGSLAWYDYSAAPSRQDFPAEHFAATKWAFNNDAVRIDWPWSDVELARSLCVGLVQRLERLDKDGAVRRVVVVTHVPLFAEQMLRKPGDERWEHSNAYFGNLTTGEEVLRFEKVTHVVSAHTHCGRQAVVHRERGPDVAVAVVASDYGRPAFVMLDLPTP